MEKNAEAYLEIRKIWEDDHTIELNISASNGIFSGETQLYTTEESLTEWAEQLAGFPKSDDQEVTFYDGERESYSYSSIRAYTFSGMAKTAMHITLESNVSNEYRKEEKAKLEFELFFEPAALDRFIPNLQRISDGSGSIAIMKGIKP